MNIEPLYDKVVVKQLSDKEVTASGIVLPDSVTQEKPMEGEVVVVRHPRGFRVGARNDK